jgi:hypothetical protein
MKIRKTTRLVAIASMGASLFIPFRQESTISGSHFNYVQIAWLAVQPEMKPAQMDIRNYQFDIEVDKDTVTVYFGSTEALAEKPATVVGFETDKCLGAIVKMTSRGKVLKVSYSG